MHDKGKTTRRQKPYNEEISSLSAGNGKSWNTNMAGYIRGVTEEKGAAQMDVRRIGGGVVVLKVRYID